MSKEDISVREGYDRWAAVYDHDANPLLPLEQRVVVPLLGDVRGLEVLELACGTGRHTLRFATEGARVKAVDFSPGMLAVARERVGSGAAFVEADFTKPPLPFADASFDLVACFLALEHVRELEPLFAEIARVLRKGGAFVMSDMHPAMRLRGKQAGFDIDGRSFRVEGYEHPVAEYVMAALRAGLTVAHVSEHKGDDALAQAFPRAEKYVGWPMLVAMRATKAQSP